MGVLGFVTAAYGVLAAGAFLSAVLIMCGSLLLVLICASINDIACAAVALVFDCPGSGTNASSCGLDVRWHHL